MVFAVMPAEESSLLSGRGVASSAISADLPSSEEPASRGVLCSLLLAASSVCAVSASSRCFQLPADAYSDSQAVSSAHSDMQPT